MKRPWQDFTGLRSKTFVRDLVPSARDIPPGDLMDMQNYRAQERQDTCGGYDPIRITVAYGQDKFIYTPAGHIAREPDRAAYDALPREHKLNKFGLAYRRDAGLYLYKTLADITIEAAIYLYQTQRWTTVLYDGLRTVDGAYNLYMLAPDSDMTSGLLSLPGRSSHNKGLAIDSMMMDERGMEIDVGAHFDHLDMAVNSRGYTGISQAAQKNRLIREAAFMRAGFANGLLMAPLRSEFWHDQIPENREDLWRVLESAARCMRMELLSAEDERMRKENRAAFEDKWERWSYADFLQKWDSLFAGKEKELQALFGITCPPETEKPECYHGNYHPVYDASLRESGKHLTEPPVA